MNKNMPNIVRFLVIIAAFLFLICARAFENASVTQHSIAWDKVTNSIYYQIILTSTNTASTNLPSINSLNIIKNEYILEYGSSTNEQIKISSFITNRLGKYFVAVRTIGSTNIFSTNNISEWSTNFLVNLYINPLPPYNLQIERLN